MANRYWVGGGSTTDWNATGNTNWAATSGGANNASVPTVSDDVFFDAGSSANCAVGTAGTFRSFDMTGYPGTLSGTAALSLNIGNTGLTVAVKFGGTVTWTGTFTLGGTSGTANVNFNGKGGFTLGYNGTITMNILDNANLAATTAGQSTALNFDGPSGTLGLTHTIGAFSIASSAIRTINMGTCTVNCSSFSAFSVANLTMGANTATVIVTASNPTFNATTFNFNGLSVVLNGAGTGQVLGSVTLGNLTRTGTAAKTDYLTYNGNVTVTGTLTANGNSSTNRVACLGSPTGTQRTLTAAATSFSNVDFADTLAAGAGNWNLSAITGLSGDMGNNSGITFTTSATQTFQGTVSGSWSDVTKWTSRVPLPQDDVSVASAFSGGQTVTADMPRLGRSLSFVGSTGTPTWAMGTAASIYGSLTLISGMTLTGSPTLTFSGRGAYTLTTAGKTFINSTDLAAPGGSITQQDAYTNSKANNPLTITAGTWDTNSFNMTFTNGASIFVLTAGTFTCTNSTLSFSTVNAVSFFAVTAGGTTTVNATGSTIVLTAASSNTRTFQGGSKTYGTLRYTVADSPGALALSGNNTIASLELGSGRQFIPPSNNPTVIGNWTGTGTNNGYNYFPGTAGNYMTVPNSAALQLSGDMDLRAQLSGVTVGGQQSIIGKWSAVAATSAYLFYLSTTGALGFALSDGSSLSITTSTANLTTASFSSPIWVRVTWRQSDGRIQYFTGSPGAWTQLGTNVTYRAGITVNPTTNVLELGNYNANTVQILKGNAYRFQVINNVLDNGTGIQLDADLTAKTVGDNTFTESSSNAATVSILGGSAQAGDGRLEITSAVPGNQATITKSGLPISGDYIMVTDSIVTGVTPAYAGPNGILRSNTTNWTATAYSPGGGPKSLMLLGVG